MEITKTKTDLVIKVPLSVNRYNPYMGDEPVGEMDNIVGLIYHDKGFDECGFAYWIDMDYKDKGDQISDFWLKYPGSEGDFVELCGKLGFEVESLGKEEK
jgi:hypothetical protein